MNRKPSDYIIGGLAVLCADVILGYVNLGQKSGQYFWTSHSQLKMRQYRLSESRVKRVIRYPVRTEEGILENTVACMQPAGGKKYSEIWAMYVINKSKIKNQKSKIRIITAWRYPGRAPERDPVPAEILREIRKIL